VQTIDVKGGPTTHGTGVSPLELHGATGTFKVSGGVVAARPCSDRHDWGRPHTESLTAMEPRGAPFPMRFV